MFRQQIARQARLFSTSVAFRKSAVDTAKETVHAADKTVSQQIVKGIEGAEQVAAAAKETVGMGSGNASGEASKMAGQAQGEASKLAGQAQGKAQELAGQAKGAAEQAKGKM
ncbi:hypothetical protein LTR62_003368 [Meristemomyces frigidus]|uniref:Uncharacterized protein n=1 Tax=Meristemomyces frigidus TaxID=1508187 RepID=A0AAN7TIS1_9PEZI|nr:hypothetical protein LTR62_003368 [Meristemomyces frigidus]